MRQGDFGIEVIPANDGTVRETDSGHVLARPGQVYRLRLRNFGPLRCVADVAIDGHCVTAGGIVIDPWRTVDLERPVDGKENGRFTVVAEGDEAAFGPDGGRDDPSLGLIEATFRRELPQSLPTNQPPRIVYHTQASGPSERTPRGIDVPGVTRPTWSALHLPSRFPPESPFIETPSIERAAGTGLTGHSNQSFVPTLVGPLEQEPTVLRLRIVIGSEAAIADSTPRPLTDDAIPARPEPRP